MSSDNLSDVLGSIGNTDSTSNTPASSAASSSGSASRSGSSPASVSATASASRSSGSGSASSSGSGSGSASGSNTLTNAPSIGSSSSSVTRASTITGAPSLTSGAVPHLSDLPTLSGYYSYPPASVPPTANAPYMQRTTLPENFVFIVVGAVIAFVALVIIAWHVLTSWSINRRFRRHEGTAGTVSQKASYTPLADFKQKPSGAHGPSGGHDMKDLGTLPRNFSSVPSLFFSPTAEVAQRNSSRPMSRDPTSQMHLPAGHYRDASRT